MYKNPNFGRANPRWEEPMVTDQGGRPYAVNLVQATRQNNTFRTALWTGEHLQLTVMSIPPGGDIGLEMHPHVDQLIFVVEGRARVMMGSEKNKLTFRTEVSPGDAFIIPAGTWHNAVNAGRGPLKVFSVYGPPNHPFGTVHQTKEDEEDYT